MLAPASWVAAAPTFSGEAAFRHVERLVAIGPRVAGSPAGAKARDYIVAELKKAGVQVRVEAFDAETPHGRLSMANVIGVVPGRRADVILIGGHYDTKLFADRRFVGAKDGGSSAALLLELARQPARRPRELPYRERLLRCEEARRRRTPAPPPPAPRARAAWPPPWRGRVSSRGPSSWPT